MVDNPAALPPSGVVALSEPDPDMTAMLSQAAENVGLMWNPPPRPDPSRMDKWFLVGVSLFLTAPYAAAAAFHQAVSWSRSQT